MDEPLPLNRSPLNQRCKQVLLQIGVVADPYYVYGLQLAIWGLEKLKMPGPSADYQPNLHILGHPPQHDSCLLEGYGDCPNRFGDESTSVWRTDARKIRPPCHRLARRPRREHLPLLPDAYASRATVSGETPPPSSWCRPSPFE